MPFKLICVRLYSYIRFVRIGQLKCCALSFEFKRLREKKKTNLNKTTLIKDISQNKQTNKQKVKYRHSQHFRIADCTRIT